MTPLLLGCIRGVCLTRNWPVSGLEDGDGSQFSLPLSLDLRNPARTWNLQTTGAQYLVVALAHTGSHARVNATPCTRCSNGHGWYQSCRRVASGGAWLWDGACTNCANTNHPRDCSLYVPPTPSSATAASAGPTTGTRRHRHQLSLGDAGKVVKRTGEYLPILWAL